MDWSEIVAFVVIAVVVEVSPGPNFLLVARTIADSGRVQAFANIGGFATAFFMHGSLSIFGVTVVLASTPGLLLIVKMAGAGYLCFLGVQSLRGVWHESHYSSTGNTPDAVIGRSVDILSPPFDVAGYASNVGIGQSVKVKGGGTGEIFTGWRDGFITNSLNPKISLFYLAVFPQFIGVGNVIEGLSFILVGFHVLVNALWFVSVALALEKMLASTRGNNVGNSIKVFSGAALIVLSAGFAYSAGMSSSPVVM